MYSFPVAIMERLQNNSVLLELGLVSRLDDLQLPEGGANLVVPR